MEWMDGHLDLTYIADHGRDLTAPRLANGQGEVVPVCFQSLHAAGVNAAISTIFVRKRIIARAGGGGDAGVDGPYCFDSPEEAYQAALRQVAMHGAWEEGGWIHVDTSRSRGPRQGRARPTLQVTLALEGAGCLRSLDDLQTFYDSGVRMVSLAWAEGSAWAGGDQSGGDVTAAGRALIERLDQHGCVHDVSHLSEQAFWTLMDQARGPVVASHSNCRMLLSGAKHPERHLSDEQIRAIAKRGGLIGINLFARFLASPEELRHRRATCADVVRHMEHMAEVAGRRDFLALGSDMDSGFGQELLPADLQGPTELVHLAEALSTGGWSDREIAGFATRWSSLPALALPCQV